MPELYYKIIGGAIVKGPKRMTGDEILNGDDGHPIWRPYVETAAPSYDSRTHTRSVAKVISNTAVTQTWTLTERPLADVKAALKADLDQELETRGQALLEANALVIKPMIYQERLTEASAADAEQSPQAADYPVLAVLIGSSYGDTIAEIATAILAERAAFKGALAAYDGVEVAGKAAIDAAADVTAAKAAYDAVTWP